MYREQFKREIHTATTTITTPATLNINTMIVAITTIKPKYSYYSCFTCAQLTHSVHWIVQLFITRMNKSKLSIHLLTSSGSHKHSNWNLIFTHFVVILVILQNQSELKDRETELLMLWRKRDSYLLYVLLWKWRK